ncbi:MAG: tetratricopeptide (TPR) repeat protein [Planctomycetota bacterium]|jgi:tetratricopeptide (TPR) repeat protein
MGVVNRMFDKDLRRTLAMKVTLRRGESKESKSTSIETEGLARFLEEARITGQLDHPGVVPVHDCGFNQHGNLFFTMRLVNGQEFTKIIELVHGDDQAPEWNMTRALGVLLKVCEAMSFAHDKQVVHRDLKPSNVMVGRHGEVYVMDWGLARMAGREDRHNLRPNQEQEDKVGAEPDATLSPSSSPLMTQDGTILGTPYFMPPEQAAGRLDELGPRSDVYSLGAMLYHLLSGRQPYYVEGKSVSAQVVLAMVREGPPQSVEQLSPKTAPELVAICQRAMSRNPAQRYADMGELAEDLRAYLEGRVVQAHQIGAWAEVRKWVQRNKAMAGTLALFLLVTIGGLTGFSFVKTAYASDLLTKNEDLQAAQHLETEAREKAEAVQDFLQTMLASVRPGEGHMADVTVRTLVDEAARGLATGMPKDPALRASLHKTLADTYTSLGLHKEASEQREHAIELLRPTQPDGSWEMALMLLNEVDGAINLEFQGSLDPDQALQFCEEAISICTRLYESDHGNLMVAKGMLARLQSAMNPIPEASNDTDLPDWIVRSINLAIEMRDGAAPTSNVPATAIIAAIEDAWASGGAEAGAQVIYAEIDGMLDRELEGPGGRRFMRDQLPIGGTILAKWASDSGRYGLADSFFFAVLELLREDPDPNAYTIWLAWKGQSQFFMGHGKWERAIMELEASGAFLEESAPSRLKERAENQALLAQALLGAERLPELMPVLTRRLEFGRRAHEHGGPVPTDALIELALEHQRLLDHAKAEPVLLEAWGGIKGISKRVRQQRTRCAQALVELYTALEQPDKAEPYLEFTEQD